MVNDFLKSLEKFNLENTDPCWFYLEDMKPWATAPCSPKPGKTCPACGRVWEVEDPE